MNRLPCRKCLLAIPIRLLWNPYMRKWFYRLFVSISLLSWPPLLFFEAFIVGRQREWGDLACTLLFASVGFSIVFMTWSILFSIHFLHETHRWRWPRQKSSLGRK